MRSAILAVLMGLLVTIAISFPLAGSTGIWIDYIAITVGACVIGLIVPRRHLLLGGIMGMLYGVLEVWCVVWVMQSFHRHYGIQINSNTYIRASLNALVCAVLAGFIAEITARIRKLRYVDEVILTANSRPPTPD